MKTEEFIEGLVADIKPVRPLRPPGARTVAWMAISLPYVAAVAWAKLATGDPVRALGDTHFLIQQAATLTTALTAAVAAFRSAVPGYSMAVVLLPIMPLGLWVATAGHGCMQDWLQVGIDGLAIRPDWDCLPIAAMMGVVPAATLIVMLRKAAPLHPRITLALAALAVASLVNLGLQFAHFRDASIIILVWHLGAAAVLVALGGWLGKPVMGWQPRPVPTR